MGFLKPTPNTSKAKSNRKGTRTTGHNLYVVKSSNGVITSRHKTRTAAQTEARKKRERTGKRFTVHAI